MGSKLLIIDDVCPFAYSPSSLWDEKLPGGTEASVIRIACGLQALQHEVYVKIHCAEALQGSFSSNPCPFVPDSVIILRSLRHLEAYRELYPTAKFYLWLHDLVSPLWKGYESLLQKTHTTLICVSNYHLQQAMATLEGSQLQATYIYNPIDEALAPDDTLVDPKQLIFFSNPNKGLAYTLKVFEQLYMQDASFKLLVARPNCEEPIDRPIRGVRYLGALPYPEVIRHVRGSLCAFHLNHVYPETFGLVSAEANAVGTPVLTHPQGASCEILDDPRQLINTWQKERVIKKVIQWSLGHRPKVQAQGKFKLSKVLEQWEKLLQAN